MQAVLPVTHATGLKPLRNSYRSTNQVTHSANQNRCTQPSAIAVPIPAIRYKSLIYIKLFIISRPGWALWQPVGKRTNSTGTVGNKTSQPMRAAQAIQPATTDINGHGIGNRRELLRRAAPSRAAWNEDCSCVALSVFLRFLHQYPRTLQ